MSTLQFFRCPCPSRGNVILDGKDVGPNRDTKGKLLTKQCNEGLHVISLKCKGSKHCDPPAVTVHITGTDPIQPLEVPFKCL